jgi:hypothetical protein
MASAAKDEQMTATGFYLHCTGQVEQCEVRWNEMHRGWVGEAGSTARHVTVWFSSDGSRSLTIAFSLLVVTDVNVRQSVL